MADVVFSRLQKNQKKRDNKTNEGACWFDRQGTDLENNTIRSGFLEENLSIQSQNPGSFPEDKQVDERGCVSSSPAVLGQHGGPGSPTVFACGFPFGFAAGNGKMIRKDDRGLGSLRAPNHGWLGFLAGCTLVGFGLKGTPTGNSPVLRVRIPAMRHIWICGRTHCILLTDQLATTRAPIPPNRTSLHRWSQPRMKMAWTWIFTI